MLRLLGTTGHKITASMADRLPEPELAVNATILLLSELADRGPLRPRDLMPVTGVTSGGMTRQLDRLEALGLVERRFGAIEGDRRAIRVSLTAAGRAVTATMSAVLDEHADAVRDLAAAIGDLLPSGTGAPGWPDGRTGPRVQAPSMGTHTLRLLGRFGAEVRGAMLEAAMDAELVDNLPVAALCEIASRGPSRPIELVDRFGLSSGGMTKLLDRLEERGLVERKHGAVAEDRRAIVVSVTPDGDRLVDRFAGSLADRRDVLAGLAEEIKQSLGVES
jgi:DNA-binding MarR family transcriptional regulator